MRSAILSVLCLSCLFASAQTTYRDSIRMYIYNYTKNHEVVKGQNLANMHFFDINSDYRVTASFERVTNSPWFEMNTSGLTKKVFRVYGKVSFTLQGTPVTLSVYQSQDGIQSATNKTYLFLPFTDATTGHESYAGGRYIDLKVEDIQNNKITIDFNKAYNPYCAYVAGKYNCPVPPASNAISIPIKAGERAFGE